MNQESVNDSEWNNPNNWWGGLLYHSRLDVRIWVPKRTPSFGVTINLGRPVGLAIGVAILALIIALIITKSFGY